MKANNNATNRETGKQQSECLKQLNAPAVIAA
jgi:hypothetical protein